VLDAVRNAVRLWRGTLPTPAGLHDFLVSRVKLTFSRPLAFQIAGDARGERPELELHIAQEQAPIVDWEAARQLAR
jgi:diacylglycerol kinase family enzyme